MSSFPIAALFVSGLCLAAPRETVRVPWEKVAETTANKKVSMTLPSGTKIRGVVISAEPQALIFDVTGTSNAKEIPKRMTSLPRTSVSSMEATKCSRKMRILLTLAVPVGLLAGTAAAINVQTRSSRGGGAEAGALAAAGIGGSLAGYYLGKSLDCHVTQIVVGE